MIKVGLCGSGNMGIAHVKCFSIIPGVRVTAIASKDEASAGRLARASGAKIYSDAGTMIRDADIDMVDICLPTPLHCSCAVQAARRGLDILCEKPIALTVADATRMIKAVRAARVKCMIAHVIRFYPEYEALKDYVDSGKLGKLLAFSGWRFGGLLAGLAWKDWFHNPKLSGGAILDLHIHDVDYVRYLLGEPRGVNAVSVRRYGGWNYVFTNFYYPDTAVSCEAGWTVADPFTMGFRAVFEKGTLTYDLRHQPLSLCAESGKLKRVRLPKPKNNLGAYHREIKYFVDCLKKGRDPKIVTLEDARASLALVHKVIASAERNRRR